MTIRPKNNEEQAIMREGGQKLSLILSQVNDFITIGKSTKEIDSFAHECILKAGAEPSFKGYHNYPASSCLSVNEAVVHGIPNDYVLQSGDVIGVDIGIKYNGYHTDAAFTKGLGELTLDEKKLLQVTQESLRYGLEAAIAGNTVANIGEAIQSYIDSQGKYGIVRDLTGHGIGANLQESPEIFNIRNKNSTVLVDGMTLAIEPMVSLGDWRVVIERDDWTVSTRDESKSAHFETTIIIRGNDPEILVAFPLEFPC